MVRLASMVLALMPAMLTPALAHTSVGDTSGFGHGVTHPFSGIDHILAMVAIGLFAAHLGGRALWLVPLSFIFMMIVGGAVGMLGIELPFVELGISLSVVVLGVAIATRLHVPTVVAMALAGFFAIFHGHAHGMEMPESASGFGYGVGFVLATASLHALGIGLGVAIGGASKAFGNRFLQATGSVVAIAGIAILTGYL